MKLTLTVPWEHLCPDNRKFLNGKFILSAQYRDAKDAVKLLATVAAKKAKWVRPQGAIKMTVRITEPDHRRRDILNHAKMLCDAITASEAVWWDDSQISLAVWERAGVEKNQGSATITVETL